MVGVFRSRISPCREVAWLVPCDKMRSNGASGSRQTAQRLSCFCQKSAAVDSKSQYSSRYIKDIFN